MDKSHTQLEKPVARTCAASKATRCMATRGPRSAHMRPRGRAGRLRTSSCEPASTHVQRQTRQLLARSGTRQRDYVLHKPKKERDPPRARSRRLKLQLLNPKRSRGPCPGCCSGEEKGMVVVSTSNTGFDAYDRCLPKDESVTITT